MVVVMQRALGLDFKIDCFAVVDTNSNIGRKMPRSGTPNAEHAIIVMKSELFLADDLLSGLPKVGVLE